MKWIADDAHRIDLDAAIGEWRREGFARVGRVLHEDALGALCARCDDVMLGRVRHDGLFFQHDAESGRYVDLPLGRGWIGPSLEYRKIEKLERDPMVRAWIENPIFERIARAIVGDDVVLYRAILMTKGARGGTPLPWHQDGGSFWGLDRDPELQIWTALDDAPIEAGCVEIVPRSHRAGLATPLGGVIPDDLVRGSDAELRAIRVPTLRGEVVLLHNHVWHRSAANQTGRTRRALSFCYMPASTKCLRKKRAPRAFVPLFRR
jgi:hypothetical protein